MALCRDERVDLEREVGVGVGDADDALTVREGVAVVRDVQSERDAVRCRVGLDAAHLEVRQREDRARRSRPRCPAGSARPARSPALPGRRLFRLRVVGGKRYGRADTGEVLTGRRVVGDVQRERHVARHVRCERDLRARDHEPTRGQCSRAPRPTELHAGELARGRVDRVDHDGDRVIVRIADPDALGDRVTRVRIEQIEVPAAARSSSRVTSSPRPRLRTCLRRPVQSRPPTR